MWSLYMQCPLNSGCYFMHVSLEYDMSSCNHGYHSQYHSFIFNYCTHRIITSAFKEYWGQAWADYYCGNSYMYICSSASGVSTLLICMALHPQITCRHCSRFSVMAYVDMNVTKQQYIGCFQLTQACVGKLQDSYGSTVSVGWISGLYHVSAHSPTCRLTNLDGRHELSSRPCCSVECSCKRTWACKLNDTEHFRACTDLGNQGVTNTG